MLFCDIVFGELADRLELGLEPLVVRAVRRELQNEVLCAGVFHRGLVD